MKRMVLVLLLLGGLVAVQGLATDPPSGIMPADVGSAYACYPSCILPNYIIAEDLDSDGWLDLAVSCFGNSQVWTYENTGAGIFLPSPNGFGGPIGAPLGPTALVSGIFIRNGYPDVGVLSTIPARVSGLSFFAPTPTVPALLPTLNGAPPVLPAPVEHMAVGDFDRADGLSDVVIADTTPALRFYTSGGGAFTQNPIGAAPSFVVVADFDQNGWDDVAVSCANNTVEVYYHVGAGVFVGSPVVVNLGAITPRSMDVADFNNDGFPDIVVAGNSSGAGFAQVLLNSPLPLPGFALLPAQPTWGTNARFVEAFDADGNGWTDFAVANYGSHTVTVFLTEPVAVVPVNRNTRPIVCLIPPKAARITVEPKFKYELQCGYYPTGIAAGDFDRNGKMDMAISLYSATLEINPQVPSCIEVIFDVACGFQPNQTPHRISPEFEPQACEPCVDGPCAENRPPIADIQTESDTKNP